MALTEAQRIRRQKRIDYMKSKKDVPCADCGVKYPICCMDFHHEEERNQHFKKRVGVITEMKTWSIKRIDEELDKCVVLCANCHRIRHHQV